MSSQIIKEVLQELKCSVCLEHIPDTDTEIYTCSICDSIQCFNCGLRKHPGWELNHARITIPLTSKGVETDLPEDKEVTPIRVTPNIFPSWKFVKELNLGFSTKPIPKTNTLYRYRRFDMYNGKRFG